MLLLLFTTQTKAIAQNNQFDQFELRALDFATKSKTIHQNILNPAIAFTQGALLLQDLEASYSDFMAKAQLESFRLQSESEQLQLQRAQTITYFAIACSVLLHIIVISLFFVYR